MKFYTFGDSTRQVFMTIPGTICHWKLGFYEIENTVYPDMRTQAVKTEAYAKKNSDGHVFCICGCSLLQNS